MEILELTTREAMVEQLPIIRQLYADFTLEKYESLYGAVITKRWR